MGLTTLMLTMAACSAAGLACNEGTSAVASWYTLHDILAAQGATNGAASTNVQYANTNRCEKRRTVRH